jgi:O-antigen/teichoic acid export membrane protein
MTHPSAREKVAGAIPWTVAPRIIQLVASLFTSILIVRVLGKFDYGTLSVLRPILIVAIVIIGFGMGQALNRFIPELRITNQASQARRLLYRSLLVQSGVWFVFCLTLIALRPILRERIPTYADLFILGVGLGMTEVAAGTVSQYAIASYRTGAMALATGLGALIQAAGTGMLLYLGMRVPGVLLGTAAGFAANTLFLAWLLQRGAAARLGPSTSLPSSPGPPASEASAGRDRTFPWSRLLPYALPWVPNNILTFVVWRQSETFLLGILRTREEAGLFDLAYKLPQLVLEFVPGAVYPLVLAGFAETATVARERMGQVITSFYRLLFFAVAPLSVLGFALGDVLLARMYGATMASAGPYCQAFFIIFALSFFGTPLSMTVYVVEKVWVNLLLNVGYAVVTVGLDLLLIPRYGLLGATIPTGIVTALTPLVRYYIARRYLEVIKIPWGFIGRAYLASSPLLLLFWAKTWVRSTSGLALLLLVAAGAALFFYRIFRVLGPEERAMIERSGIPAGRWILRVF